MMWQPPNSSPPHLMHHFRLCPMKEAIMLKSGYLFDKFNSYSKIPVLSQSTLSLRSCHVSFTWFNIWIFLFSFVQNMITHNESILSKQMILIYAFALTFKNDWVVFKGKKNMSRIKFKIKTFTWLILKRIN